MGIFKKFYPDEYKNSSYDLDYEEYYKKGIRGVIFDIDNTLVPHGFPADEKAAGLMERLHAIGFKILVLSNNKQKRVESFAKGCGEFVQFIFKADKPSRRGYVEGMKMLGTNVETTMFIGDQIFTDVWGARRSGIYSVLVKPINPREEIQIVLKRIPEKMVLFFYKFRQKRMKKNEQ